MRPDISFTTHSCVQFSEDPREPHAVTVEHLDQYLSMTRRKTAQDDPSTAKSHTGYVITYANCLIV
eukprot:7665954-Ditylum_brightwellii.AAC.3